MATVYLDHAATTPPSPAVKDAMSHALDVAWGNPSSPHTRGVEAERLVNDARRRIAAALGASAEEIVFTSGGTEANALALFGAARPRLRRRPHIVTTALEHSSVAHACSLLEQEGFRVTRVAPDENGVVRAEDVLDAVTPETALVSVMWVNNEVGTIQPVLSLAEQIKAVDPDIVVHADGVQAFSHVPVHLGTTSLDMASFSAHKIRGPKGIGALWVRDGVRLASPWGGGSQERGLRPGTENVPGIAGFGAAAEAARYDERAAWQMHRRKALLWERLQSRLEGIVPLRRNGAAGDGAAPHILNVSFIGLKGEVLVHALAEQGVFASTGSACSSRRQSGSATLRAMGLGEAEVEGALRFSLSPETTDDDVEQAADIIGAAAAQLRQFVR